MIDDKQIKTHFVDEVHEFPFVIQTDLDKVLLVDWVKNNRSFIEDCLLKYGAVLFRGFKTDAAIEFERAASHICPSLFGEYSDLPKTNISRNIYKATPYPADQIILFHNESAHMPQYPLKIFFFCAEAAEQGGETPIASCRKVLQKISPAVVKQMKKRGLMYVRNFSPAFGGGWQEYFNTTDKAAVENYCHKAGIEFEWKSADELTTRQRSQAVTAHPKTGEPVFFSQVQLFHQSYLDPQIRTILRTLFSENNFPRNVYYGDGALIEDEIMNEIGEIYWDESVRFAWQEGDFLVLDNMLTAHARMSYKGSRKILVAMGEMISAES